MQDVTQFLGQEETFEEKTRLDGFGGPLLVTLRDSGFGRHWE